MDIALLLIVAAGLAGTMLPAVPGSAIILAGALFHAVMTDFHPITWPVLALLTVLFLAGWLGQYAIAGAGSKKMGASRYGMTGAVIGLFIGLVFPVPGGILMGAFAGAVAGELLFGGQETRQAMRSGLGALAGTIASMFFEFFVGLVMAGIIAFRFYGLNGP